MKRITKEQLFATRLERNHSAKISDEERRDFEVVFGPGSIRSKLSPSGTKILFKALSANARDADAPITETLTKGRA